MRGGAAAAGAMKPLTPAVLSQFDCLRRIHRALPDPFLFNKVKTKLNCFVLPSKINPLMDVDALSSPSSHLQPMMSGLDASLAGGGNNKGDRGLFGSAALSPPVGSQGLQASLSFWDTVILLQCLIEFKSADTELAQDAAASLVSMLPRLSARQLARALALCTQVKAGGEVLNASVPMLREVAAHLDADDIVQVVDLFARRPPDFTVANENESVTHQHKQEMWDTLTVALERRLHEIPIDRLQELTVTILFSKWVFHTDLQRLLVHKLAEPALIAQLNPTQLSSIARGLRVKNIKFPAFADALRARGGGGGIIDGTTTGDPSVSGGVDVPPGGGAGGAGVSSSEAVRIVVGYGRYKHQLDKMREQKRRQYEQSLIWSESQSAAESAAAAEAAESGGGGPATTVDGTGGTGGGSGAGDGEGEQGSKSSSSNSNSDFYAHFKADYLAFEEEYRTSMARQLEICTHTIASMDAALLLQALTAIVDANVTEPEIVVCLCARLRRRQTDRILKSQQQLQKNEQKNGEEKEVNDKQDLEQEQNKQGLEIEKGRAGKKDGKNEKEENNNQEKKIHVEVEEEAEEKEPVSVAEEDVWTMPLVSGYLSRLMMLSAAVDKALVAEKEAVEATAAAAGASLMTETEHSSSSLCPLGDGGGESDSVGQQHTTRPTDVTIAIAADTESALSLCRQDITLAFDTLRGWVARAMESGTDDTEKKKKIEFNQKGKQKQAEAEAEEKSPTTTTSGASHSATSLLQAGSPPLFTIAQVLLLRYGVGGEAGGGGDCINTQIDTSVVTNTVAVAAASFRSPEARLVLTWLYRPDIYAMTDLEAARFIADCGRLSTDGVASLLISPLFVVHSQNHSTNNNRVAVTQNFNKFLAALDARPWRPKPLYRLLLALLRYRLEYVSVAGGDGDGNHAVGDDVRSLLVLTSDNNTASHNTTNRNDTTKPDRSAHSSHSPSSSSTTSSPTTSKSNAAASYYRHSKHIMAVISQQTEAIGAVCDTLLRAAEWASEATPTLVKLLVRAAVDWANYVADVYAHLKENPSPSIDHTNNYNALLTSSGIATPGSIILFDGAHNNTSTTTQKERNKMKKNDSQQQHQSQQIPTPPQTQTQPPTITKILTKVLKLPTHSASQMLHKKLGEGVLLQILKAWGVGLGDSSSSASTVSSLSSPSLGGSAPSSLTTRSRSGLSGAASFSNSNAGAGNNTGVSSSSSMLMNRGGGAGAGAPVINLTPLEATECTALLASVGIFDRDICDVIAQDALKRCSISSSSSGMSMSNSGGNTSGSSSSTTTAGADRDQQQQQQGQVVMATVTVNILHTFALMSMASSDSIMAPLSSQSRRTSSSPLLSPNTAAGRRDDDVEDEEEEYNSVVVAGRRRSRGGGGDAKNSHNNNMMMISSYTSIQQQCLPRLRLLTGAMCPGDISTVIYSMWALRAPLHDSLCTALLRRVRECVDISLRILLLKGGGGGQKKKTATADESKSNVSFSFAFNDVLLTGGGRRRGEGEEAERNLVVKVDVDDVDKGSSTANITMNMMMTLPAMQTLLKYLRSILRVGGGGGGTGTRGSAVLLAPVVGPIGQWLKAVLPRVMIHLYDHHRRRVGESISEGGEGTGEGVENNNVSVSGNNNRALARIVDSFVETLSHLAHFEPKAVPPAVVRKLFQVIGSSSHPSTYNNNGATGTSGGGTLDMERQLNQHLTQPTLMAFLRLVAHLNRRSAAAQEEEGGAGGEGGAFSSSSTPMQQQQTEKQKQQQTLKSRFRGGFVSRLHQTESASSSFMRLHHSSSRRIGGGTTLVGGGGKAQQTHGDGDSDGRNSSGNNDADDTASADGVISSSSTSFGGKKGGTRQTQRSSAVRVYECYRPTLEDLRNISDRLCMSTSDYYNSFRRRASDDARDKPAAQQTITSSLLHVRYIDTLPPMVLVRLVGDMAALGYDFITDVTSHEGASSSSGSSVTTGAAAATATSSSSPPLVDPLDHPMLQRILSLGVWTDDARAADILRQAGLLRLFFRAANSSLKTKDKNKTTTKTSSFTTSPTTKPSIRTSSDSDVTTSRSNNADDSDELYTHSETTTTNNGSNMVVDTGESVSPPPPSSMSFLTSLTTAATFDVMTRNAEIMSTAKSFAFSAADADSDVVGAAQTSTTKKKTNSTLTAIKSKQKKMKLPKPSQTQKKKKEMSKGGEEKSAEKKASTKKASNKTAIDSVEAVRQQRQQKRMPLKKKKEKVSVKKRA